MVSRLVFFIYFVCVVSPTHFSFLFSLLTSMSEDDLIKSNQQTYQKKLIEIILYTNLSAENVAEKLPIAY